MSLSRTTVRGVTIVALTTWIVRAGYIGLYILLARRLTLHEYGLAASVLVVSHLFGAFATLGFQSALIQQGSEPSEWELNAAWTVDCFLVRTAAAGLLLLSAYIFASFFGEPALMPALMFLAFDPFIAAFENSALVVLSRRLEFRRRSLLLASNGLGFVIGTGAAVLIVPTFWAVVAGTIFGRLCRTTCSYVLYNHVPRLVLDRAFIRSHWVFARGLLLVALGEKVRGQSDKLLVGRLLGINELGVYQFCSRVVVQTLREFTKPIRQVLFPTIARIADSRDLVRRDNGIIDVIEVHVLIGVTICATAIAGGPAILDLAIGGEWVSYAYVIRAMGGIGLLVALNAALYPVLRGMGMPGAEALMQWVALVVLVPGALFAAPRYGMRGVLTALMVSEMIQLVVALHVVSSRLRISSVLLLKRAFKAAMIISIPFIAATAFLGLSSYQSAAIQAGVVVGAAVLSVVVVLGAGHLGWLPGASRVLKGLSRRRSATGTAVP